VPFLLHDATLERTTSGSGASAERSWEELCTLDAGLWHSEAFRGERLPSFEDAARLLRSMDTLANVEIKPSPRFEARPEKRWRLRLPSCGRTPRSLRCFPRSRSTR
jgi:glycerophosphoryl diester phosphodiesterase